MKAFELTFRSNMVNLPYDQRQFAAAMVVHEVQKIAEEQNISEETAYEFWRRGLFGADREVSYVVGV